MIFRFSRTVLAVGAAALLAVGAAALLTATTTGLGLESCSAPTPGPEDLTGAWEVSSHLSDDDGCQPEAGESPIARIEVESWVDDEDDVPGIAIIPCPTDEICARDVAPEDQLRWSQTRERGESIHHSASFEPSGPVETRCRLSGLHTMAIPDGQRLEFIRSYYELTLPLEGDESCTEDLAEEYRPQMPCVRSEIYHFDRPAEE